MLILAGIIIGIAVIYIVVWSLLRRRKKRIEVPELPDPYETALLALAQMRSQSMRPEEAEAFFVKLSQVVRNYLEGRFGLHAPEMTTEEFIRDAADHASLSDTHQKAAAAFLSQSDMVKFAQYQPDETLMISSLDAAERLVKETKQSSAPAASSDRPPEESTS